MPEERFQELRQLATLIGAADGFPALYESKNVHDRADAFRPAARIAKKLDLEVKAAQLRFQAERRLGALIAAQKAANSLAMGAAPKEKVFATSFAKRQTPLPVVEVRDAEKLAGTNHGKNHHISRAGFAGISARARYGHSGSETIPPAPEDLEPISGYRNPA